MVEESNKYYYGIDLLNGIYGTGGTGGIRMININGQIAYPFNNATGNIETLFDDNGNLLAEYEYTPFGNIRNIRGSIADKNPMRFSSRYYEGDTNLYYYSYRHYCPSIKKWLSQDPIGEQGGVNLYNFVGNNSVFYFDILGSFKSNGFFPNVGAFDFIKASANVLNNTPLLDPFIPNRNRDLMLYLHDVIPDAKQQIKAKGWYTKFKDRACSGGNNFEVIMDRFKASGLRYLIVGYFYMRISLHSKSQGEKCPFELNVSYEGISDDFDFNKSDHRDPISEAITALGRYTVSVISNPFKVVFYGDGSFSEKGVCP